MSDLHQCPCNPACTCKMDEPCLGCEDYGRWLELQDKPRIYEVKRINFEEYKKVALSLNIIDPDNYHTIVTGIIDSFKALPD